MKKTAFYNIHKKLGAKLVDFAGFDMPIQYSSIIAEHKAVRTSVGIFDVSHMGEVFISGNKALEFVQHITVNDASTLSPGRVQYSAMCYPDGGIVDDLLVYKLSDDEFMLVVNASNIDKDYKWMIENNKLDVKIDNQSSDYSLIAVQGPNSHKVVQKVVNDNIDLEYYHFKKEKIAGTDVILSRTGYTGEIGYEIYFKGNEFEAEKIWTEIFEAGKEFNIQPAGLAARDSLRLEMGFCLYGNDIDKTTNTIEAGLGWITKLKKGNFIGREALQKFKDDGVIRKLVGMISDEKIFPRKDYPVYVSGKGVGSVTSGTVSPILEKPIALGYVEKEYSNHDTEISFLIRGKEISAKVVKLPFIKK
ncbi:MAG: glycine cleavage system aminomethyltransferase GcvT [Ignavibacteria bacterium]|nr:glycine cleavage system aminomethyltransferase GcvT [Ignavibacteria bacterium]MBT8381723.1 glycine cleavage system aminomethyltransferase GcvT [Ignavibacteria bacterium]MBT8391094.1 glycine cleavage system aminomethyltransferase GcvT [Ignavibacteria bacterium]NNL21593.1 glycine cleavage system aminomethyltransferase GcvT [Ignavibacteriaceae bacterium]